MLIPVGLDFEEVVEDQDLLLPEKIWSKHHEKNKIVMRIVFL